MAPPALLTLTHGLHAMSNVFVRYSLGWLLMIGIMAFAAKMHPVFGFLLAFTWESLGFDAMTVINLLNL